MNPQRNTSAKFICVRAPMTNAPMMAKRISAYIASAERRVKIHISISKLRPRFVIGTILDFVEVAMLASQSRADDDEERHAINGDEHRPLNPDGFALIFDQCWKQVEESDAQAVDGVK